MADGGFKHGSEHFWLGKIVRIDKSEVLPARRRNSGIPCVGHSPVRLMHHPYARVLCGEAVAHLRTAVGRAVVNEDDLNVGKSLRPERRNTAREVFFNVVYRDDYADLYIHFSKNLMYFPVSEQIASDVLVIALSAFMIPNSSCLAYSMRVHTA